MNRHAIATILLIESNESTRETLELALANRFAVDSASDSNGALALVRRRQAEGLPPHDALLIDLNLTDGPDGYECLQHIRGCEGYSELAVPAVAITDSVSAEETKRCADAGFEAALHEQLLPEVVEAELELLLEEDAVLSAQDAA